MVIGELRTILLFSGYRETANSWSYTSTIRVRWLLSWQLKTWTMRTLCGGSWPWGIVDCFLAYGNIRWISGPWGITLHGKLKRVESSSSKTGFCHVPRGALHYHRNVSTTRDYQNSWHKAAFQYTITSGTFVKWQATTFQIVHQIREHFKKQNGS
jgi:hypothetical protein